MSTYDSGNPSNDEHVKELLRRALLHDDKDARSWVQQHLEEVVRGWLHRHPDRETVCRLDSEEHYVAFAFERFWQLTIDHQIEFSTLTAALRYLRLSLNGAILDTLRAYSRPKEVPLPRPAFPEELLLEDVTSTAEVWEYLQTILLNVREQRLAYLLFHCGLKPGEIVHFCSQEFRDVRELHRLRRSIMDRLLLLAM